MSTYHPSFGRPSGFGNVFKSLTKSLKTTSIKDEPIKINPTVVGGTRDQQRLFHELTHGTLPQRAVAADKIAHSLGEFAISSTPEIWYMVRDLCDPNVKLNIRRSGLRLMIRCIEQDDADFVSNKLVFFRDLISYCANTDTKLDPEYDLFLAALRALTRQGKEVVDFCTYDESRSFLGFLETTLTYFTQARPLEGEHSTEQLVVTLQFLQDCFMFNGNIMDSVTMESLLAHTLKVVHGQEVEEVVLAVTRVILALVESNAAITTSFNDLVLVLCSCYNISDDIDSVIWSTIHIIYATPMCIQLLYQVLSIINSADLRQYKSQPALELYSTKSSDSRTTARLIRRDSPLAVCLGAILVLELVSMNSCIEDNDRIDSFHSEFINNLKLALAQHVPVVNTALLRMFDRIFAKAPIEPHIRNTDHGLVGKVFPFYFWHSPTHSLFDLLNHIQVNNEQDKSYWKSMCMSIQQLHEHHEINCSKERLVDFFMEKHSLILESNVAFVLKFYADNSLCILANPFQKENISMILNHFYFNNPSSKCRVEALSIVLDAYRKSWTIFGHQSLDYEVFFHIFRRSLDEADEQVRPYLFGPFLNRVALGCPSSVFIELCSIFAPLFPVKRRTERFKSLVSSSSFASSSFFNSDQSNPLLITDLAKSVCTIFVATSSSDGAKAAQAYDLLMAILQHAYEEENYTLLLVVSRCMVRMRVTVEGFVYFTHPTDMGGLASSVKRNIEDLEDPSKHLWVYPEEVSYLPEDCFDKPTPNLTLFDPNATSLTVDASNAIDFSRWFSVVLNVLETFVHWEIYSFLWAHMCTQLSNVELFGSTEQILRIRVITCDQLQLKLPKTLSLPRDLTRGDLQVTFIRTLLSLLAYHDHFSKYDEDAIVNALVHGLSSWEKTAIPCIHILTICCYEVPLSIKKFLSVILTQLQTRVTSALASTHTLEFLMSLIHIPSLTSNFTIDEYMRVFGIAFEYIELARDIKGRLKNDEDSRVQLHGIDAEVDRTPSTMATGITPILTLYLLSISYDVISNWFLKMALRERPTIATYLISSLKNCSGANERAMEAVDDQTAAFIDFIHYFADSNVSLKIFTAALVALAQSHDDTFETKNWIVGRRIVTVQLNIRTGLARMIIRSGSGVRSLELYMDNIDQEDRREKPYVTAAHILSQFHMDEQNTPVLLGDDYMSLRAILTIDRIPTVAFHKVGIVYVGPGQHSESEVLGNQIGSRPYLDFLNNVGTFVKLQGCDKRIYVGGLDTENGTDGEYGLFWSDKITQLVFHVTTLMKNNDGDKYYDLKKRHIGNNYVNVFFDESGREFNFNLIKTQFNFMNIVVSPHTKSSSYTAPKANTRPFFKVKTYRRAGVPGLFATCHFKLISEQQLPLYIRNLAIIANQFATLWHTLSPKDFLSNWARRVQEIDRLRERALETQPSDYHRTGVVTGSAADSFLQQLELK